MTDKLPILIRSLRDADHPLILDSWVNSIRYSSPAFFWVPSRICKTIYRRMLVRLLEKRPDLFRVLVNEENEDQIFGWVCGDKRVTHFVYVKEDFRREGLASMLIPGYCGDCESFVSSDNARNAYRTGFCAYDWTEVGKTQIACSLKRRAWTVSHWTRDCERIGRISYRPSLFQEVIRGIDQAVGDSSPQTDKHLRQAGTHVESGEPGQTEVQPAGV